MISELVAKDEKQIRPLPKEPERGCSSEDQTKYDNAKKKITEDNKKLNEGIARKNAAIKKRTDRLKDDLRTLDKPHPAPPFVVSISMRQFARMDPDAFILWLNWQAESNGKAMGKTTQKK